MKNLFYFPAMKSIFKIIFPAVLFVTFLSASAQAQNLKIATVDLGRVFTNYYKTKLAQTQLNDDKAQVYQDENNAVAELKKGDADYQSLLTSANDSALSADERDKKKQAAAAKLQDLQSKKAALDEYLRSAQARLTDEMQRVHDKILFEIRDTV